MLMSHELILNISKHIHIIMHIVLSRWDVSRLVSVST